jgi:hypothetical protein
LGIAFALSYLLYTMTESIKERKGKERKGKERKVNIRSTKLSKRRKPAFKESTLDFVLGYVSIISMYGDGSCF